MTLRVLSVFGTRPEAIKMAPLVQELARDARFESRVCVTAQHRALLDRVLELFDITPDHDLSVMAPGQDLFDVTSKVLLGLRGVLRSERPDLVLVHGDTTTCLAASLAAFYEHVPIGHVEAGLRSFDLELPFPEEFNRRVTDMVARLMFAPTERSRQNLLAEGVDRARIHVTGNTGIDALRLVRERVAQRSPEHYRSAYGEPLTRRLADSGPVVLVTAHRRESFGEGIDAACAAIEACARARRDVAFVWPVHPNPNVGGPVRARLQHVENVHLCEPLEYEPFVALMNRARVIVTDSGGIQEEAPSLGVPVLVTRDVTERPEALDAGCVRLVGTDGATLRTELERLLDDDAAHALMARAINPYGDGFASRRIVAACATLASSSLQHVGAA